MEKTIEIPEGYEARIEGNKVILERKESEDERISEWLIKFVEVRLPDAAEFEPEYRAALAWLKRQKYKEKYDRMAPIYENKESFESALDKAWKFYNESASATVDGLEDNCMELAFAKGFREGFLYKQKQKEHRSIELSEDERIRKEIIEYLTITREKDLVGHPERQRWIAYLERQKEQKLERINIKGMVAKYSATNEYIEGEYKGKPVNCMIRAYEQGIRDTLLKVKEQKPAEVNDEGIELSDFEDELFSAFSDGWQQYLRGEEVDVAQWAKEHSAQLLNAAKQELKPAEWSEEDEKNIEKLDGFLSEVFCYGHVYVSQKDKEELQSWLKSLRPQPHWRPSEEQMEALDNFIWAKEPDKKYSKAVISLYDELKKL